MANGITAPRLSLPKTEPPNTSVRLIDPPQFAPGSFGFTPEPSRLPPGAGYTGTGGDIAHMAGSFLKNFTAARQSGQAQAYKKAAIASDQANELMAKSWQNYVEVMNAEGVSDEDKNAAKQRYDTAAELAFEVMGRYSDKPPKGGTGEEKRGIRGFLGKVFGTPKVEMYSSQMLSALQDSFSQRQVPMDISRRREAQAAQLAAVGEQRKRYAQQTAGEKLKYDALRGLDDAFIAEATAKTPEEKEAARAKTRLAGRRAMPYAGKPGSGLSKPVPVYVEGDKRWQRRLRSTDISGSAIYGEPFTPDKFLRDVEEARAYAAKNKVSVDEAWSEVMLRRGSSIIDRIENMETRTRIAEIEQYYREDARRFGRGFKRAEYADDVRKEIEKAATEAYDKSVKWVEPTDPGGPEALEKAAVEHDEYWAERIRIQKERTKDFPGGPVIINPPPPKAKKQTPTRNVAEDILGGTTSSTVR